MDWEKEQLLHNIVQTIKSTVQNWKGKYSYSKSTSKQASSFEYYTALIKNNDDIFSRGGERLAKL